MERLHPVVGNDSDYLIIAAFMTHSLMSAVLHSPTGLSFQDSVDLVGELNGFYPALALTLRWVKVS